MSYRRLIDMLDDLAVGHDNKVYTWAESLVVPEQVCTQLR